MNLIVLSEQVSSEKKNSGKDFSDSSDFLATCWITQGATDKKNILKYFGWTFQTLILHFSRGIA